MAKPPVCRIMDYGKFKYREAKKQHEAKLKQKQIQVKEVKFRPGTDEGDYKIKLRNLRRFLAEEATRPRSRCASAAARWRTRTSACACSSGSATTWSRVAMVETVPETRRPADGDAAGPEEDVAEARITRTSPRTVSRKAPEASPRRRRAPRVGSK